MPVIGNLQFPNEASALVADQDLRLTQICTIVGPTDLDFASQTLQNMPGVHSGQRRPPKTVSAVAYKYCPGADIFRCHFRNLRNKKVTKKNHLWEVTVKEDEKFWRKLCRFNCRLKINHPRVSEKGYPTHSLKAANMHGVWSMGYPVWPTWGESTLGRVGKGGCSIEGSVMRRRLERIRRDNP